VAPRPLSPFATIDSLVFRESRLLFSPNSRLIDVDCVKAHGLRARAAALGPAPPAVFRLCCSSSKGCVFSQLVEKGRDDHPGSSYVVAVPL